MYCDVLSPYMPGEAEENYVNPKYMLTCNVTNFD
jgi:hypothetical protein